jgi:hypothetical protein
MAALAVAGGCNSPTKPTNPNVLSAQLLAVSVVPPVLNSEAQGTGFATITLQIVRDSSGTIVSAAIDFQVTLANLPANTALTEAHLHFGLTGEQGALVVDTGLVPGEVTLPAGTGAFTKLAVGIPTTVAEELLASPENFYFDVHSARNLSGAVRGQLAR